MKKNTESRKAIIEKAKTVKANGGVGAKTVGLSNRCDQIVSTANKTTQILKTIG
nr:hypothetical protein [uncultured Cellulosilyticum sp.]